MSFICKFKKTFLFVLLLISFYWGFTPLRQALMRTETGGKLVIALRKEIYLDPSHVISTINLNRSLMVFMPSILTPTDKQGMPIVLDSQDQVVCKSIRMTGAWERHLSERVLSLIKPTDVIVEVGANFGYYTLLMGKALGPEGKIYTYEANPDVYEALSKSLLLNSFSDKIIAKNIAVADQEFSSYLTFTQHNVGGGHVILNTQAQELEACHKTNTCRPIHATSLDKDLTHLPKIDFLRMDAEGSEIMIFKGARELIKRSPNLTIVMEWSSAQMSRYGDVKELLNYLAGEGFHFWDIDEDGVIKEKQPEELVNFESNIILSRTPLKIK